MRFPLLPRTSTMLALVVSIFCGCSELPVIESGVCGNGVIEPGEDCDSFAPIGLQCRSAEQPGACRYDCSRTQGGQAPCPSGYGCGTDGVCRSASGSYEVLQPSIDVAVSRVLTGDFDGDGRDDIMALRNVGALGHATGRFLFLDEPGELESTFSFNVPLAAPHIGDFDGDKIDDVVFSTLAGLGVLVGQHDRTLRPLAYPVLSLPKGMVARMTRVAGYADNALGHGVLVMSGQNGVSFLTPVERVDQGPSVALSILPEGPEKLAKVATLDVVPESPCEELVLSFRGKPEVWMIEVCDDGGHWRAPPIALQRLVSLPAGHTILGGFHLGDINHDGEVDVVAGAEDGRSYVSFGCGGQTFCSQPATKEGLGEMLPLRVVGTGDCEQAVLQEDMTFPLAIGDLDGDGISDVVTATSIVLVQRAEPGANEAILRACPIAQKFVGQWTSAVVADVNRDGRLDVIAGSSDALDLDFYAGTGMKRLNREVLPTAAPVNHLLAADFDGDMTIDVAIGEQASLQGEQTRERITIAFGRAFEHPEEPVLVGEFPRILQMSSAHYDLSDAIEEIGIVAESEDRDSETISVLLALGSRQLFAPYGLEVVNHGESGTLVGVPLTLAVRDLTADSVPDIVTHAIDGSCQEFAPCGTRLWSVPGAGGGRLQPPLAGEALPADLLAFSWSEQSTYPELSSYLVAAPVGMSSDDLFLVAPQQPGGMPTGIWRAEAPLPGTAGSLQFITSLPWRVESERPPVLVDLDSDGTLDLAVLMADDDAMTRIVVLWGGADSFSFDRRTELLSAGEQPLDFALVPSRASQTPTLIGVAADALYSVERTATGAWMIETIDSRIGGSSVAAGDLNGDGVMDLVIAVPGGLRLVRGEPVAP